MSNQYLFKPAQFQRGQFSLTIQSGQPILIPGSVGTTLLGVGGTPKVFSATIHPDCHDFGKSIKFALKRIDDHDQAQQETEVLTQLYQGSRAPVHPHIADVYSGSQFEGSTYLICERANSALSGFLRANSKGPWPLHLNQQWLLSQFRGLAQAVEFVHCGSPAQSIFHQDIRADNILAFTDSETN
jgi:serine/threonine protein kinase